MSYEKWGFDFETWLISPGRLAPAPVCLTGATEPSGGSIWQAHLHPDDTAHVLHGKLTSDVIVFGANTPYDVAVSMARWPELIRLWFRAYDEGRVLDVEVTERLLDIARGRHEGYVNHEGRKIDYRYSLADIVMRRFQKDRFAQKKEPSAWRLRFAELANIPLHLWPKEPYDYAIEDSTDALAVGIDQAREGSDLLRDAPMQSCAKLSLHLMSCWGVHTDPNRIRVFQRETEARFKELSTMLQAPAASGLKIDGPLTPLVRSGKEESRDTKAAKARMVWVSDQLGLPIVLTESGEKLQKKVMSEQARDLTEAERTEYASLAEEACEDTGDELLIAYAERTSLQTTVSSHIPALLKGAGETPIQPSYNSLVDSGRTSARMGKPKPGMPPPPTNSYQIQNPKRKGNVRGCFVAREGTYFNDADYSGLELCTVAQALLMIVGWSKLADALNAGVDPHLAGAAQLMEITYEECYERRHETIVKENRNAFKPANFGFPGGLGAPGFVVFARKSYGVRLADNYPDALKKARKLKEAWLTAYPEFGIYFKHIKDLCDNPTGVAHVEQLFTGRQRGLVPYTAACNTIFQGLGADVAKRGMWAVTKRCYDQTSCVFCTGSGCIKCRGTGECQLFGTRPWGFVHDQIISESPIAIAHEAALAKGKVMEDAGNVLLPDVPVKCKPCLSLAWCKDAEAVYDAPPSDGGRMVPFDQARDERRVVYYEDGSIAKWKAAA